MPFAHCFKPLLASTLMLALVACAPTAKRQGTGEYFHDALITTKVKTALVADPDVKASEVRVETFNGTVQLSGFVSSRDSIEKAIKIARGVGGVLDVQSGMTIK